jgi:hypothetical protein
MTASDFTGVWTTVAGGLSVPGLIAAAQASTPTHVYTLGGHINAGARYRKNVDYAVRNADGTLGAWTSTTPLPTASEWGAAAVCNGYLYLVAGEVSASTKTNTVYYAQIQGDGSVGAWTMSAPYPIYTMIHQMVSDGNGHLIVCGGLIASNSTAAVYYCTPNPTTGAISAWTGTAPMIGKRYGHMAVINNGRLFVVGGSSYSSYLSTVESAAIAGDGSVGTWVSATSLPLSRLWSVGVSLNDGIWIIGGIYNGVVYRADTYYATVVGSTIASWATSVNPLPAPTAYAMGALAGNRVTVVGGLTTSDVVSTSAYRNTLVVPPPAYNPAAIRVALRR